MKTKKIKFLFLYLSLLFTCNAMAQIKVACIGNSITYGSGIENRELFSYPAQLQMMLGDAWEVQNFGVSGATMLKKGNKPYWEESKFEEALAYKPDVVIIKLGTNDTKPVNWKYGEEYEVDYQAMIDQLSENSNPVIFLCKPVPAYEVNFDIRGEVVENEVVPVVERLAGRNNLTCIDLFTPFENLEMLFPDKIHPNAHGAALMAGIIAPHLIKDQQYILLQKLSK